MSNSFQALLQQTFGFPVSIYFSSKQFDVDLPEYRTHGGVHAHEKRVTAPPIMWVKALDMLMEKLRIAGVDFSRVAAISGAGQVHHDPSANQQVTYTSRSHIVHSLAVEIAGDETPVTAHPLTWFGLG